MARSVKTAVVLVVIITMTPICDRALASIENEPTYLGESLSYWLNIVRQRDKANMSLAFEAIEELGPAASSAVPELTQIVSEPFVPIEIGLDDPLSITAKVSSIRIRGKAVDALGAIGGAAASSTLPLADWALATRVIAVNVLRPADSDMFADLVTLDVMERMRVAGAISRFGAQSFPSVKTLLLSSDDERRKLGVAILSQDVLPLVADLLKSRDCEDQKLGIALLFDMWPVVAKEHFAALKSTAACNAN